MGGGGHALVVTEAARLSGQHVAGFFDDAQAGATMHCRLTWLGGLGEIETNGHGFLKILAVGNLALRAEIINRLQAAYSNVIHPSSIISYASKLGLGSFVGAAAVISPNVAIGPHAIINTRAVVEHDCEIADNVHVGPGTVLGGGVRVGSHTLLGLNSTIKPNVVIGCNCVVGAGAVVVRDVYDGETVVGVPARSLEPSKRILPYRRSG